MSKPIISMIWAMDNNRLIGKNNALPWRLPADLTYFMNVTMGHSIVMGRKTFESFPKRPLPGRTNIILTKNLDYEAPEGCVVVHSVEEVLAQVTGGSDPITANQFFVVGGVEIYKLFLPIADRLYITHIDGEFEGDAYFPEYDESKWTVVSEKKGVVNETNPYPHVFKVYERRLKN